MIDAGLVREVRRTADWFRARGVPVVFTQHGHVDPVAEEATDVLVAWWGAQGSIKCAACRLRAWGSRGCDRCRRHGRATGALKAEHRADGTLELHIGWALNSSRSIVV